jgi:hypothetical protein
LGAGIIWICDCALTKCGKVKRIRKQEEMQDDLKIFAILPVCDIFYKVKKIGIQ